MYSFVHNKSRNRLTSECAKELVYIYTNSKTIRERAAADPTRWYTENMMSKDSMTNESDGLDRGSVLSKPNDDDSNDSSNDGDEPPFDRFGVARGVRPIIDASIFEFEEGDNNDNDHEGHERGPPRMSQTWDAGSSGRNTNEDIVAPRPLNPNPVDVQVDATIEGDGVDAARGREEDVVVPLSLPMRNTRAEGAPHGGELNMPPPNRVSFVLQCQIPVLDNPQIQSSSRPSTSAMRPFEPTSSIGARLASINSTLNMSERAPCNGKPHFIASTCTFQ